MITFVAAAIASAPWAEAKAYIPFILLAIGTLACIHIIRGTRAR